MSVKSFEDLISSVKTLHKNEARLWSATEEIGSWINDYQRLIININETSLNDHDAAFRKRQLVELLLKPKE